MTNRPNDHYRHSRVYTVRCYTLTATLRAESVRVHLVSCSRSLWRYARRSRTPSACRPCPCGSAGHRESASEIKQSVVFSPRTRWPICLGTFAQRSASSSSAAAARSFGPVAASPARRARGPCTCAIARGSRRAGRAVVRWGAAGAVRGVLAARGARVGDFDGRSRASHGRDRDLRAADGSRAPRWG